MMERIKVPDVSSAEVRECNLFAKTLSKSFPVTVQYKFRARFEVWRRYLMSDLYKSFQNLDQIQNSAPETRV